jgi:hypothetical protein
LTQGTQLREKESGFRYTPTTCFETFPFPFSDDLAEQPVSVEAELDAAKHYKHIVLREETATTNSRRTPRCDCRRREGTERTARALAESAEWTVERILEFPGSANGPWARYVHKPDKNGIGTVRYPRLEPRDPTLRSETEKAHAHEPLQRAPRVA